VFFDSVVRRAGAGSVELDNERGTRLLVDHLVEHGHRRIALLAGSQTESSGVERLRAFRKALRTHELSIPSGYERLCRWSLESARLETHALLDARRPPSAVVASSAELALGCIAACRERGVALPHELALVVFDDPYFGALLEPPLTAVSYDPRDVGSGAASLLVDAMRDGPVERRRLRVPVTLVRRRSCGCPGADER
jgi:LacI family transcriptional regulator